MTVVNKNNNESKILKIRGAGENNLKNINIDIPKNKFVVFTGVSGTLPSLEGCFRCLPVVRNPPSVLF